MSTSSLTPSEATSAPIITNIVPGACVAFLDSLRRWVTAGSADMARQQAKELVPKYIQDNLDWLRGNFDEAKAHLKMLANRKFEVAEAMASIHTLLAGLGPRNWPKIGLFSLAFLAAGTCEVTLSMSLGALFGASEGWLMWAAAALPFVATIAVAILEEWLLDALGDAARHTDRWLGRAALVTTGVILIGALAANLEFVRAIARSRTEAGRVLEALIGTAPVQINDTLVASTVVTISIVLVLNLSILCRRIFSDLEDNSTRSTLEKNLAVLSAEESALRPELEKAEAELDKSQAKVAPAREKALEEVLGKEWLVKVEIKIQEILHDQTPTLEDHVHAALLNPLLSAEHKVADTIN